MYEKKAVKPKEKKKKAPVTNIRGQNNECTKKKKKKRGER